MRRVFQIEAWFGTKKERPSRLLWLLIFIPNRPSGQLAEIYEKSLALIAERVRNC